MNITLKDLKASLLNDLRNETFKDRYYHFTDDNDVGCSVKIDAISSVKWWSNTADIHLENGNHFTLRLFDDLVKLRMLLVGDEFYNKDSFVEWKRFG